MLKLGTNETGKWAMAILGIVLAVILTASVAAPILSDMQETMVKDERITVENANSSNNGMYYREAATGDTLVQTMTIAEDGSNFTNTITLNGTEVTVDSVFTEPIFLSPNLIVECDPEETYAFNNDGTTDWPCTIIYVDPDEGNLTATNTITVEDGTVTFTSTINNTTINATIDRSDSAIILCSSDEATLGLIDYHISTNAEVIAESIDEIYFYSPDSGLMFMKGDEVLASGGVEADPAPENLRLEYSNAISDKNDALKEFTDFKINFEINSQTCNTAVLQVFAPLNAEYTESTVVTHPAEYSMVGIIPLLMIVGIILAVVGIFISSRRDY